jgi:hypothetical protein
MALSVIFATSVPYFVACSCGFELLASEFGTEAREGRLAMSQEQANDGTSPMTDTGRPNSVLDFACLMARVFQ